MDAKTKTDHITPACLCLMGNNADVKYKAMEDAMYLSSVTFCFVVHSHFLNSF